MPFPNRNLLSINKIVISKILSNKILIICTIGVHPIAEVHSHTNYGDTVS